MDFRLRRLNLNAVAQGVGGLVFGSEQSSSNEDSYVQRYLDRISNGVLAEDRRSAMVELQSLVAESRSAQLAFSASGLPVVMTVLREEREDVEMIRGALETLVSAVTSIDSTNQDRNEVHAASMNADLLSREPESIPLLINLLSEDDFYIRYYTLQLLTALLSHSHSRLQETILSIPRGITCLMDMLMDREVIRNEALLLLTHLTREAEEIQKIVVFEGAFEKIFSIIKEEGGSEGGVVVQDSLELLKNLIRKNASNQILLRETVGFEPLISILKLHRGSAYNFTQQKTINLLSALETVDLLLIGGPEGDPGKDANRLSNQATFAQRKILDHLLMLGVESQWASLSVRCLVIMDSEPTHVEEHVLFTPPGSTDPGWKYAYLMEKTDPNSVTCRLCGKVLKGGINRMKQHLGHIKGNCKACPKANDEVQKEIRDYIEGIVKKKNEKAVTLKEMREEVAIRATGSSTTPCDGTCLGKRPRSSDDDIASMPMRQTVIKETLAKEERARVNKYVAKFFCDCDIPFNVATKSSFIRMCEAIGQYGSGYKSPSYYEIAEPLLKDEVEETKEFLKSHKDAWKKSGCSIMTDAWTDMRGRSIMNLCVNSSLGTCFLKSVDASADAHTAEYISALVEDCIKEVGVDNVLQVVTDNASANMAAGRLLKTKYPKIFWSSCAAHCIDLILEEFGKEPKVKNCIAKARTLTIFIYSHAKTLSLMRHFTQKGEIVRPGQTRFATCFLTLQSVFEKKEKLRLMFSSDEWRQCKWSKTRKGEVVGSIVLSTSFWSQVSLTLKVFSPLIRLLRIVDGDRRPSLSFVYGGLEDAKKEIKSLFKDNEHSYKPYIDAIDSKSKGRLDSSLHLAAYYLNPYYFYRDDKAISEDSFVIGGFLYCLEIFYPDLDVQDVITTKEMVLYKNGDGPFGKPLAIKQRSVEDAFDPANWWSLYGGETPYMKAMALKILKLTSSSSGCERNWSSFAAALRCIGDLVYLNPQNCGILSSKVVGEEPQVEPALNSILRIILRTSTVQEFISADHVFKCFCERNNIGQAMLVSTMSSPLHSASTSLDSSLPFGSMLLHGLLFNETNGDIETSCRAASVLFHILKDNIQCKEQVLRVVFEAPVPSLGTPEPLMHRLVMYCALATSSSIKDNDQKSSKESGVSYVEVLILRLLVVWLADCPTAVDCFLNSPSHLTYLLDLSSNSKSNAYVRGLVSIILGECALFNKRTGEGSKDAFTVVDIISQKIGLTSYFCNFDDLEETFIYFSSAPITTSKPIARSSTASATDAEDTLHDERMPVHPILFTVFNIQFIEIIKKLEIEIRESIVNVFSNPKNKVVVLPGELEQNSGEPDGEYIKRLKTFIQKQCNEMQELLSRNATLAESFAQNAGIGTSGSVQNESSAHERIQSEMLRRNLEEATRRLETLKSEREKSEAEADLYKNLAAKMESELKSLSDAYNSLEPAYFQLESEVKALRTGGGARHADIEAIREEAREAAEKETEAELNDLLVCLGQEQSKVEKLSARLLELGEDVDSLLEGIGDETVIPDDDD